MMKVLLKNSQSPGDILMLTACVRDLKASHPEIRINCKTSAQELWDNNPCLDRSINEANADRVIDCHYPLINQSNLMPWHFIHGFRMDLENQLGLKIPQGEFCCDVHLNDFEKSVFANMPRNTAICDCGYKNDFTNKMWEFARYQEVIDRTKSYIHWVQIGARNHNHRPLDGVENLIGCTTHRQLIALMYQASLVLTPVSYPMHLATMQWRYGLHRPCIVVAGGREPAQWEAYGTHQYIHRCGMYDCNVLGGCWRSRIVALKDRSEKDKSLCVHPVKTPSGQIIPRCMDDITVDDVVRAIELYRGALSD